MGYFLAVFDTCQCTFLLKHLEILTGRSAWRGFLIGYLLHGQLSTLTMYFRVSPCELGFLVTMNAGSSGNFSVIGVLGKELLNFAFLQVADCAEPGRVFIFMYLPIVPLSNPY